MGKATPTIIRLDERDLRKENIKDIEETDLKEFEIPDFLFPGALDIYKDLVIKVNDMRILMPIDCYTLGMIANRTYEYTEMMKKLGEPGQEFMRKDKNGVERRNPLLTPISQAITQIQNMGKNYGFTPTSRVGLPVEVEEALKKQKKTGSGSKFQDKWQKFR